MKYNGYHFCDRCNTRYDPCFTIKVPFYDYNLCRTCAETVLATYDQLDEETKLDEADDPLEPA